jgi:hypothetical protein
MLSLAVLAVAFAARAQGASPSNEAEVRRFVVAVRYAAIYKAMAAGFVARAGKPANVEDAKFQSFMRRVAAQPEASFVPAFATVFQRSLTTAEAKELADFFESTLGKKVADLSVARAQSGESAQAAAKNVSITEEDKAAYARFVSTDVYKKYAGLVTSPPFAKAMMMELAKMPAFVDLGLTAPASGRK